MEKIGGEKEEKDNGGPPPKKMGGQKNKMRYEKREKKEKRVGVCRTKLKKTIPIREKSQSRRFHGITNPNT